MMIREHGCNNDMADVQAGIAPTVADSMRSHPPKWPGPGHVPRDGGRREVRQQPALRMQGARVSQHGDEPALVHGARRGALVGARRPAQTDGSVRLVGRPPPEQRNKQRKAVDVCFDRWCPAPPRQRVPQKDIAPAGDANASDLLRRETRPDSNPRSENHTKHHKQTARPILELLCSSPATAPPSLYALGRFSKRTAKAGAQTLPPGAQTQWDKCSLSPEAGHRPSETPPNAACTTAQGPQPAVAPRPSASQGDRPVCKGDIRVCLEDGPEHELPPRQQPPHLGVPQDHVHGAPPPLVVRQADEARLRQEVVIQELGHVQMEAAAGLVANASGAR